MKNNKVNTMQAYLNTEQKIGLFSSQGPLFIICCKTCQKDFHIKPFACTSYLCLPLRMRYFEVKDFKNMFLRVRYCMSTELNSNDECFKYFKEYPGKWMPYNSWH